MSQIFTPHSVIGGILRAKEGDYQTCTKIMFGSYEISIASDQSCTAGNDLIRSEIRIYLNDRDVTNYFLSVRNGEFEFDSPFLDGNGRLCSLESIKQEIFNTSEDLFWIMSQIKGK